MIGAEHGVRAFMLPAGNFMQIDKLLADVVPLSLFGEVNQLARGKLAALAVS